MRTYLWRLTLVAVAGLAAAGSAGWIGFATADEEKVPLEKVPKAVLGAVKKRFPKAELVEASKDTVDGKTDYEVILKNAGQKIDVSLTSEGAITQIEKQITAADLPKVVKETVEKAYPKSTWVLIEELIKVKAGKEKIELYEVGLETADKKKVEVQVGPDGKVVRVVAAPEAKETASFTDDFAAEKDALASTGRNPYFILEPGYQLVLEGGNEKSVVTVLNETKTIDGVECRIVEERETKAGKLIEISRNYYAIGKRTNSVYYFGEDVDIYQNGKVVAHEGSWMSGKNGAKYGLIMSGLPIAGARYYQEVAPKAAMDRAEIVGVGLTLKTPAGEFKNCVKIEETTPLEPGSKGYKMYAPGIGMVQDGDMLLVKHGKVTPPTK